MDLHTFYGLMIPFLGTSLGSACVFFMKKEFRSGSPAFVNWFCSRSSGGSICVESINPST